MSADCVISQIREYDARVVVRDEHGATASASARARGVNQAPVVTIGPSGLPPNPAPANASYTIVGNQPFDPDGDENPNQLCVGRTLDVSGPCRAAVATCGGVSDGLDIDLTTLSGPGTCSVEVQVRDSWGAVGSDHLSFHVNAP